MLFDGIAEIIDPLESNQAKQQRGVMHRQMHIAEADVIYDRKRCPFLSFLLFIRIGDLPKRNFNPLAAKAGWQNPPVVRILPQRLFVSAPLRLRSTL